jgi:drug/metabolite transporter (DMT)-like permease
MALTRQTDTGTPAGGFAVGTWGALLGMALVSQHLGHSCYNYSLRYVTPGLLTVTLLSEPVLSSLAAWLCFGEVPHLGLALAALLLIPGIWLVARDRAVE